jgi:hypothetical protein
VAFQRKKAAAIGVKAPFPGFIEPALATSIDKMPSGDRWIHEIKFDGLKVPHPTQTTDWFGHRRAERDALQLSRRTEALPAAPDPLAVLSTRSLVRPYSTRMPDGL